MSACDTIDIHGIGKIQSYGYLISLDKDSLDVNHVSANILDLPFCIIDDSAKCIGFGSESCVSAEVFNHMESMVVSMADAADTYDDLNATIHTIDSYLNVDGISFLFSLDETASTYTFSIQQDVPPDFNVVSLYTNTVQSILSSTNQQALFEETCTAIADLVGYERAMVYSFGEDLSGEVVYEWIDPAMNGKIEPYIGMRFPESDIPLPARQMYLLKPIRIIHDTSTDPVDVLGATSLNLSTCVLRASHDVHITYMRNMGVKSSLSLAIILGSDLWGIVSLHSYSKVCLPRHSTPRIIESLCRPCSMTLQNILNSAHVLRQKTLSDVVDNLIQHDNISRYFSENHLELLKITATDSIHLVTGDTLESWGDTGKDYVREDTKKLQKKASRTGFYVGALKKPTRGIVYVLHGSTSLVLYRKTKDIDTIWGGDPNHVKIKRPDGVPGPRGSFERYVLKNQGVLDAWTEDDKKLFSFMSRRMQLFIESKKRPEHKVENRGDHVAYNTMDSNVVDISLLAHMSHEILTPLNGISSSMKIVMEDRDIERSDVESLLGEGLECVQSMKSSIEGVMSIAGVPGVDRLDNSTEALEQQQYSIKDIGDAVVSKYSNNLKAKAIAFSYDSYVGKDHCGLLGGHASTIKKCVFSAIDNALRFTESGGRLFYTVSYNYTHREAVLAWKNSVSDFQNKNMTNVDSKVDESDTRTWYSFTVRDTGCGIHEDMVNNVVATVSHAGVVKDVKNNHQGIGVGMYRGMFDIMKMDGTVAVASSIGVGSSISFIVPIEEDHGVVEATIGEFFVVDDSSLNRKMTSRLLKMACKKSLGFEPRIREFSDGRVCMEEVLKMSNVGEKPLCIIMDHHMPVMSGKEATEHIRRLELEKGVEKIPIVGYTADVTDRTREDLLSSGMNTVISKPISMDVLVEMCNNAIKPKIN